MGISGVDADTLIYSASSRSDVGCVRTVNEDAFLSRDDARMWVVADGMGGHAAGDLASGMVVEELGALDVIDDPAGYVDAVENCLTSVNERLRQIRLERESDTIGCTVVALLAFRDHALCMWAGDSRIYHWRKGVTEQITTDHALVEELVTKGMLTREQARHHPQANLITRAVGAADRLFLDLEIVPIEDGDQFLLCSDGLTGEVSDTHINEILTNDEITDKSDTLVSLALESGGHDNTTAVVVQVARRPEQS